MCNSASMILVLVIGLLCTAQAQTNSTDINSKDRDGRTALMKAALFNKPDDIKALLEKGADPNIQDDDGRTALMLAVVSESVEGVKFLLASKADVTIKDRNGKTALTYANELNNKSIIRLINLFSSADPHVSNSNTQPTKTSKTIYSDDLIGKKDIEPIKIGEYRSLDKDIALYKSLEDDNFYLAVSDRETKDIDGKPLVLVCSGGLEDIKELSDTIYQIFEQQMKANKSGKPIPKGQGAAFIKGIRNARVLVFAPNKPNSDYIGLSFEDKKKSSKEIIFVLDSTDIQKLRALLAKAQYSAL